MRKLGTAKARGSVTITGSLLLAIVMVLLVAVVVLLKL